MLIKDWPNGYGKSIIFKDISEAFAFKKALEALTNDKLWYPNATTIQPLSNDEFNTITLEIN
jgi:hypothetical protein